MKTKLINDEILLQKPALFFENYFANEKIRVNQGGTWSGKTYTVLDLLFVLGILHENYVITIVAETVPNLKKGAYRDAKAIWKESELCQAWYKSPNETDRVFTCKNGTVIEFNTVTTEQDAKSGKRHILFVNEANGIPFNIYWQLAIRTSRIIFIDYNPTAKFWVHEQLIGKPDVKLIISDHRHNPFLTEEQHKEIESIEDKELFKVYARGRTGLIQGLIYTKWRIVEEMPTDYKSRWIGIDFGFTNDPTAIIDVRLSNGELWVDEIEYKTGLTNPDISKILYENGIDKKVLVIADSAEPKSIAELKNLKHFIEGAKKGPDSIKNGIDILQRYMINVTRNSKNIRKEIGAYKWKEDKNGEATNVPIEIMNHALDAIRYVGLNKLGIARIVKKPKVRTTRMG